jgi:hypothetical protein
MATTLHILTKPNDALANDLIAKEKAMATSASEVVDLTTGEPDYKLLVEKIFAADSVQVW